MKKRLKIIPTACFWTMAVTLFLCCPAIGKEVNKGEIPPAQLAKSFKSLAWGAPVWDNEEAINSLNKKEKALWVDTRPESLYKQGSVRGAVVLPYDKQGGSGNVLTKEKLAAALSAAGLAKDKTKIIFFCQGPTCHRSYNATFVAVTQWGYDPQNIIWYRDGYPELFKKIKEDPQLKRKAKSYLTDEGVNQL